MKFILIIAVLHLDMLCIDMSNDRKSTFYTVVQCYQI